MTTVDYKELVRQTQAAYYIKFEDDEEPIWIPKSQVEIDEKNFTVAMPEWLFNDKFPNG